MLAAASWEEACAISFRLRGKKLSRQTFGILRKIRQVDDLISRDLQARVFEGHPEVTFAMMNNGRAMLHNKRGSAGRQERLALLRPHFPEIDRNLSREILVHCGLGDGRDDVVDAYACLWTARRVVLGQAVRIPTDPQCDERGLFAVILA
jgi:predicted RNase H-like nuclease